MRTFGPVMSIALMAGTLGVAAAVKASDAGLSDARSVPPQGESGALWQVGSCYRVFPMGDEPFHVFKVVSAPAGNWIRVESDPTLPTVPGAKPRARLWINGDAVFAVQEWGCWALP